MVFFEENYCVAVLVQHHSYYNVLISCANGNATFGDVSIHSPTALVQIYKIVEFIRKFDENYFIPDHKY